MSAGKKIAERILSERPAPQNDPDVQRLLDTLDISIAVRGSRYIDVRVAKMEAGATSKVLMHSVMDTVERETRKRLVALGWTPPEGSKVAAALSHDFIADAVVQAVCDLPASIDLKQPGTRADLLQCTPAELHAAVLGALENYELTKKS